MAYTADDLRSVLTRSDQAAKKPSGPADDRIAAPQFLDFTLMEPSNVTAGGTKQWIVRGQNFVMIYSQPASAEPDVLWSDTLSTEQMILVIDERSCLHGVSSTSPDAQDVTGAAVVIAPPGSTELTSAGSGPIVQLIETSETKWADKAANADSYREPHPRVELLEPWPEPIGGYKWRVYQHSDYPIEAGRFGRLFRSRSFMVNVSGATNGPRDLTKMSPHFHDDFEQCSLTVEGEYIHHIQTPWGIDGTQWRPEDHAHVNSPSATIIPPPTVHTSQSMSPGSNLLIDIFAGPRRDFSAQPGWVLNADEYPAPPTSN